MSTPAPQVKPLSSVELSNRTIAPHRSGSPSGAAEDADVAAVAAEGIANHGIYRALLSGAAISYYLSAALHCGAYVIAAALFYLLGLHLLPEETWLHQPIRASLDDQDVMDEDAKLELTPEINLGHEKQSTNVQQLARQLQIVDAGWIETLQTDALTAMASAESDPEDGTAGSGFFFRVPESGFAVTKGSFTAWAEPNNPRPGQNYLIVIQIRLPDDIKRYRIADLVGEVKGTDNYKQRIPYDSRARNATAASTPDGLKVVTSSTVLDVKDNKIQLAVRVPGAARLVKDTVTIRSRRLKESQELVLVFGKEKPPADIDNMDDDN